MRNLKKLSLAIFAFTSSAPFAGTMGPVCVQGNATVPCERSAWDFGVQALYLQPSIGVSQSPTKFSAVPEDIPERIQPHWGWGIKLDGSYHFSTGNDMSISWYNYTRSVETSNIMEYSKTTARVNTELHTQWDAVNAEFGQLVQFGQSKKIRFHGGAQYSYINLKYSDSSVQTDASNPSVPPGNAYSKYYGFGPRAGADMFYDIGHHVEIYAAGAGALLVGRSSTGAVGGVASPSGLSGTLIVPELEGKLGAKWTPVFSYEKLTLDAGYMWQAYLNTDFLSASQGNFFLNGPYLGLKWVSSV